MMVGPLSPNEAVILRGDIKEAFHFYYSIRCDMAEMIYLRDILKGFHLHRFSTIPGPFSSYSFFEIHICVFLFVSHPSL